MVDQSRKQPVRPDYGEIDLGEGTDPIPGTVGLAQPQTAPQPAPSELARPAADRKVVYSSQAPKTSHATRKPRPELSPVPPRSYAREIKILAIVLAILAVIAGAIVGFVKWRESVREETAAELDRLDQGSLDALKEQAVRKDKLAP